MSPGKRIQLPMPFPRLRLLLCTLASTMMFWWMPNEKILRHQHTEPPSPTCSGEMSLTANKETWSYRTSAPATPVLSLQCVFADMLLISSMVSLTLLDIPWPNSWSRSSFSMASTATQMFIFVLCFSFWFSSSLLFLLLFWGGLLLAFNFKQVGYWKKMQGFIAK